MDTENTEASEISPTKAAMPSDDWFLVNLVEMVTETKSSLGITLSVGGMLISGSLCSGAEYFVEFGKTFGSALTDPDTRQAVTEAYAGYAKLYEKADGVEELPKPSFIHLKNACCFTSERPLPTETGILWRGRISSVDGFFLGSLQSG